MSTPKLLISAVIAVLLVPVALADVGEQEPTTTVGDKLDASATGTIAIEHMDDVMARERAQSPVTKKDRNGGQGLWAVPSPRATFFPYSGKHYVANKWGDTRMGIGFPQPVDLRGAYFAGQGGRHAWTTGVRVVGYRSGQVVGTTGWFREIGDQAKWFEMNLVGVDRIVIESEPAHGGGGWYAMDDLTFAAHENPTDATVIDFEDTTYRTKLTGTNYAGLTWETGTGEFMTPVGRALPVPGVVPSNSEPDDGTPPLRDDPPLRTGTTPTLLQDWESVAFGSQGSWAYPPDTMGATGLTDYVTMVNEAFQVYNKSTGAPSVNSSLEDFFNNESNMIGDPRIVWDVHSNKWFCIATDFDESDRIYIGVSSFSSASSFWFKGWFDASTGTDVNKFPDYPTLGVDENGVYISAAMFPKGAGSTTRTLWALDKAPLIDYPHQAIGDVWTFRNLPSGDGALQMAHSFGGADGAYVVGRYSSQNLKLRRVNTPSGSAWTLDYLGYVPVVAHSDPPNAPALGGPALDAGGPQMMMALYRNGYVWTCHNIGLNGRGACRWYQINPSTMGVAQYGTVSDPTLHFIYPSIMVNANADLVLGCSGSHSAQYAGAYYAGRKSTDPAGDMSPAVQYKAGEGSYDLTDPWGRNRWGDYSYVAIDPDDDMTFWNIQEYAKAGNRWGTWIAKLSFGDQICRGDCNCDGQIDFGDINHFVAALGDPPVYCDGTGDNADIDGNGSPGFEDINPFVELLTSYTLPIDCPGPL